LVVFSRALIILYVIGVLRGNDLIVVDHSGKWLLSSHNKGEIILWDIENGRLFNTFNIDCENVTNIEIYSDHNDISSVNMVASCKDSTIIFIDEDGKVSKNNYPPYVGPSLIIAADAMSLSFGGQYLYCFGNDSIGYVVDPISRKFVNYIPSTLEIDPVMSKLSQDNKYLLVGYSDGRLGVWDVNGDVLSSKPEITQVSNSMINDLSLSNTGIAVVVDQMDYLYLYNYKQKKILKKKKIESSDVVLLKNKGKGIITSHHDGIMHYWQIKGSSLEYVDHSPSKIHSDTISEMVFLPDPDDLDNQTIIISTGTDKYIRFTNFINDNYINVGTIYKDDLGWVVYNMNGDYAGTRDIPKPIGNIQKVASPFEDLF